MTSTSKQWGARKGELSIRPKSIRRQFMKTRKSVSSPSSAIIPQEQCAESEPMDYEDLALDSENPRLVEYGITRSTSQSEILKCLWERMDVAEVAMSLAASGYWKHEPLFALRDKDKNGKHVVVEGNRRLAAARILINEDLRRDLRATNLPVLSDADKEALKKLPVILIKKREDIWRYLGFKHVNGPAQWGSYAKAKYVAFVKNTTGSSLVDIAAQIGDEHQTVQRYYRALMVIEQAEKEGVWSREYCSVASLSFSHLLTALGRKGFQDFLKIAEKKAETEAPVPPARLKELGEVLRWLYGDARDNTPPAIRSQNPDLKHLDSVLQNREAISMLRIRGDLDAAYEVSRGDRSVFEESLQQAKNALTKAQGRVSSGYHGDRSLLDLAFTINEMAADLYEAMNRKASPSRAPKRPAREEDKS